MSRPIHFNNHPFRFLLYLEWILLVIVLVISVIPSPSKRFSSSIPELTICSLIIFGLMGLRLPTGSYISKIFYTICEILLILTTGIFGARTARLFAFLYIILVTRSCLIFPLYGRLLVTGISFILFLSTQIYRLYRSSTFPSSPQGQERFWFLNLSLILLFGLSLVFVLLLMNTVISERKSREELAIANEKLRRYAQQVEHQATLEERNRIAREIHDSLGHSLTALNLQLETALKLSQSNPAKSQTFLARAKELGSQALQDVRHSVSAMRSHPLQEQSLQEAIAVLTEHFHRDNGIYPIGQINLEYPVNSDISTAIYRITQESLTNISKYARANKVNLELTTTRGSLQLKIQDNGRGFDLQQNTTGFGLQSMRDRTLALGGIFNINTSPGFGCQITVDIPLSRLST